jgi:hypothetical protein
MNPGAAADRRVEALRLAGACAGLLALAAALGIGVNGMRPESSRLPWVGDWNRHIETKAFRAGIPVVFLGGARERAADPAWIVFDARIPAQYEAGHLPGAFNLPLHEVDARIVALADRLSLDSSILTYCGGADCADALELAVRLRELASKT